MQILYMIAKNQNIHVCWCPSGSVWHSKCPSDSLVLKMPDWLSLAKNVPDCQTGMLDARLSQSGTHSYNYLIYRKTLFSLENQF